MPDATQPIDIARIAEPDRGWAWSMVRFPPGFERKEAGFYEADELLMVVEGRLEMSGYEFGSGDVVGLPAGWERSETATPEGAVAFAWFSHIPDWKRTTGPGSSRDGPSAPEPWTGSFDLPAERVSLDVPRRYATSMRAVQVAPRKPGTERWIALKSDGTRAAVLDPGDRCPGDLVPALFWR